MKKLILGLLMLVFIFALGFSAEARQRVTFSNEIIVDLVRYDPSPVQPGFPVDVWFEVSSIAKEPLQNVKLSIVEEFPFLVVGEEVQQFALVQGEKKQIKYTIDVNSNAKNTNYNLFLQYYSDKASQSSSQAFSIPVKKGSIEVGITSVNVEPSIIPPGSEAQVNVALQNNADYMMKDISLDISLENAAIPFAPTGTTSKKKIKELIPGSKVDVGFKIVALPSAEAGIYKVPLIIQYYDDQGNSYNKSELLGLTVGSEPEVYVEVKERGIYTSTGTGDIVLNVINKGLTNIKFLKVTLNPSDKYYDILSSNTVYIGDIDSDDEETADFRIHLKGVKDLNLPVTLEYRDANNKPYTEEVSVNLKIYSKSMMGISDSSSTWIVIVLLVLVIAFGWYFYRRRKKKQA